MKPIGDIIGNRTTPGRLVPKPSELQTKSTPTTTGGRLLKHKPLMIPLEIPVQTMSRILGISPPHEAEDYQLWARHLDTYQRTGQQWDEYAKKIPTPLRNLWAEIHAECRRNGFLGPRAIAVNKGEYRIVFAQIVDVYKKKPLPPVLVPDACTLCERFCPRRDHRGVERNGSKPCWRQ